MSDLNEKEKELLRLLKSDNQHAFKVLFELYHASLCLSAYRLVKDREVAKDVVQNVFIKFWNNRKSIEITSSLAAYLKRSVINTSLNHIEKDQRSRKIPIDEIHTHPQENSGDNLTYDELSLNVDHAINRLPVRTRAVFVLVRKEEMSYKEVGESLNISTKAVEKEMMKALKLLREMLRNFLPFLVAATFI